MEFENMEGKVVLITGATDGIGEVAARELARLGATVVIAARNPEKTERVLNEIRSDEKVKGKLDAIMADLSSLDEVRRLAETFLERYDRLDVLINNAGAVFMKRKESQDGYELTLAVNHLSHFLLTHLLLEQIKQSAPARIINVSSDAHRGTRMDFSDLQHEKGYSGYEAYGESKLANIYFTRSLAGRLEGSGVKVYAMHPGFVATSFGHNNGFFADLIMRVTHLFARSPEEGADTIVYLAASPEVADLNGKYFVDREVRQPSKAAQDDEAAEKLWQRSLELTGLA